MGGCGYTTRSNFRQADVNHDRKLDKQEFTDGVANLIVEKFDTNKDGAVTIEEWRAVEGTEDDKGFKQRDPDHDGRVTLAEARQMAAHGQRFGELFEEIDANQDGVIEWSEVMAFKKTHPEPAKPTDAETAAKS